MPDPDPEYLGDGDEGEQHARFVSAAARMRTYALVFFGLMGVTCLYLLSRALL